MESSEDAVPLTEQEKRSSFYQAVSGAVPELRNADLIKSQTLMKEMNLDEIKSFITQLEAEKRCEVKEEIKVQKLSSNKPLKRCYRCNEPGHWAAECSMKGTGKWFCYHCQDLRFHRGSDCHLAKAVKKGSFQGKFKKVNVRTEVEERNYPKVADSGKITKPNVRGRGRGRFRTVNRAFKKTHSTPKQGKNILYSDERAIEFIADSGATDHIINSSLILSDFRCCKNDSLKTANKNELADIRIDGRGSLILYTNSSDKTLIKLIDVVAASDISENLLSLRRFADAGFGIYLDDKVLKSI